MGEPPTYWGIRCQTCLQAVPFGIRPDHSHGAGSAILRTGMYECVHGHKHVYGPEDIRFFHSTHPVTNAEMKGNRAAYKRILPSRKS